MLGLTYNAGSMPLSSSDTPPEPYSGERIGELLTVGAGKEYTSFALAMDYILTKTWESSTVFAGTVTATAGSASITGTGFLTISPDNYLEVGANYWAIKSIESDTAATLWHGVQATVSGSAATHHVLSEYTIEIFDDQTVTAKTLPAGVSVKIIGNIHTYLLTFSASITVSSQFKLEITNIQVLVDVDGALVGGFATGRGILYLHDFGLASNAQDNIFMSVGLAAYIEENLIMHGARRTISTDYVLIDGSGLSTNGVSDHVLLQQNISTDKGHPITINNYISASHNDAVLGGQSSGFEINAYPAGKVIDVTDTVLYALHTTASVGTSQAEVVWGDPGTTINFTDSIIDAVNNDFEILARGATINLDATTRLDGSAVRQN